MPSSSWKTGPQQVDLGGGRTGMVVDPYLDHPSIIAQRRLNEQNPGYQEAVEKMRLENEMLRQQLEQLKLQLEQMRQQMSGGGRSMPAGGAAWDARR